jgi:hypothetical protein
MYFIAKKIFLKFGLSNEAALDGTLIHTPGAQRFKLVFVRIHIVHVAIARRRLIVNNVHLHEHIVEFIVVIEETLIALAKLPAGLVDHDDELDVVAELAQLVLHESLALGHLE